MYQGIIDVPTDLFYWLSQTTALGANGKASDHRLCTKSLNPPLGQLEVGAMSTGGLTYRLSAIIHPALANVTDPETGETKSQGENLDIVEPLAIDGLTVRKTGRGELTVRKNGMEKFVIYTHRKGWPVVISAGYTEIPSGPTIHLGSVEQFQEDMKMFAQIIAAVLNKLELMFFTNLSSEISAKWDDGSEDMDVLKAREETLDTMRKAVFDETSTFYIRSPMHESFLFQPKTPPQPQQNQPPQQQMIQVDPVHKIAKPETIKERLKDVKGINDARDDIAIAIEFLKNPTKFQAIGATPPRGILVFGPPGTGKTMLARAIAGEAGVPFLYVSGSALVEMYVGRGAGRVRLMFDDAKKFPSCIVFIDEADSAARSRDRSSGSCGEHDQTLAQLLVEMDGFEQNTNILVFVATNRLDILDDAFKSRFPMQIKMDLPDLQTCHEILCANATGKRLASDVDLMMVAHGIPGFSGRDIAALLNDAALLAIKRDKTEIGQQEILAARDKIRLGAEHIITDRIPEEVRGTAFHEAGHAVAATLFRELLDPVYKVSIIPRCGKVDSLGITATIPDKVRHRLAKEEILAWIRVSLAGRVAETILYSEQPDKVSAGARHDLKCATRQLREMITEYGLSDKMGPVYYEPGADFSDKTREEIDADIRKNMSDLYEETKRMIKAHWQAVSALANELVEKWEVVGERVTQIMKENPPETKITAPPSQSNVVQPNVTQSPILIVQ